MKDMVNVRSARGDHRYKAPEARYGRSQFSLAHSHKTSFDAGRLIPYTVIEVVPGDTISGNVTVFGRVFSPLDAPIMDDIEMELDYFYVPSRILWDNWKYFLGEHDAAGAQDTTYTVPKCAVGATISEGTVAHYMGVPIGLSTSAEFVNCLPMRAYREIYNTWYRDQNLIDEVANDKSDTAAPTGYFNDNPLISAKRHDYFTSALPYLQKGTEQTAALTGTIGIATDALDNEAVGVYQTGDGGWRQMDIGASTNLEMEGTAATEYLYADFSLGQQGGATPGGISINSLREAAAIQRLLERDAQGGTRHPELIQSHFGVMVPDYRTQRPEYLGGGKGYINVSAVANTSPVDSVNAPGGADVNAGQLAGVAAGTLQVKLAKSFVEHGYVIGILRARGAVTYSQGLDRKWSRQDRYDFLWPELANLGEQPIYNRELWLEGDATDDDVFGYQERYAEYRFEKSLVTGQFDPAHSASLDYWHLSEEFGSQPALNQTFIEDKTPMSRVTVVDSQHDFIVDGRVDLRVARVLPVRPVPSLVPARF